MENAKSAKAICCQQGTGDKSGPFHTHIALLPVNKMPFN